MTAGAEVPPSRVTQRIVVPGPLIEPHLADTSVWSKVRTQPALADWFNGEVRAGRIVTCGIVVLELLRSARNTVSFRTQSEMLDVLDRCPNGARMVPAKLPGLARSRHFSPTGVDIGGSRWPTC